MPTQKKPKAVISKDQKAKRPVGRPPKPAPRINAPVKTVLAFVLRTRRPAG